MFARNVWAVGFALAIFPLSLAADDRSQLPSVVRSCAVCHGINGISRDQNIPDLAGQNFEYLVNQTTLMAKSARRYSGLETDEDIRSPAAASHWGERRDNHAMDRQVAMLDDGAIEFIAGFFASKPRGCSIPGAWRSAAPPLAAHCATCHGENGISQTPGAPNLAGQKRFYLTEQLRLFRANPADVSFTPDAAKRSSPVMGLQAALISKKQGAELAAWYASAPCLDSDQPEPLNPTGIPAPHVRDSGGVGAPSGLRGLDPVPGGR